MAGEGLAVIELNGVTSEATNIYDPNWTIWQAQKVLRAQWDAGFAIGQVHRQRGMKSKPLPVLLFGVAKYYFRRDSPAISD